MVVIAELKTGAQAPMSASSKCELCNADVVVVSFQRRRADEEPTLSSTCTRCGSLSNFVMSRDDSLRSGLNSRRLSDIYTKFGGKIIENELEFTRPRVSAPVAVSVRQLARLSLMLDVHMSRSEMDPATVADVKNCVRDWNWNSQVFARKFRGAESLLSKSKSASPKTKKPWGEF